MLNSIWQWQSAELHYQKSKGKIGSVSEDKREATHQNIWKRKGRLTRLWHCRILCQRIESKLRCSDDCSYRSSHLQSFEESCRTVRSTVIESSGRLKTCRSIVRGLWFKSATPIPLPPRHFSGNEQCKKITILFATPTVFFVLIFILT